MTSEAGRKIIDIYYWDYSGDNSLKLYKGVDAWEYHNGNVRLSSPDQMPNLQKSVPLITRANQLLQANCGLPVGELPVKAY